MFAVTNNIKIIITYINFEITFTVLALRRGDQRLNTTSCFNIVVYLSLFRFYTLSIFVDSDVRLPQDDDLHGF